MRGRVARLGAEATWVALGQMLAFLGGFASIKVLTSELGPAAYGQLALGISIAGAINMFVYGPIDQTALRFVSVFRERSQLSLLFFSLRKFHVYAALFVGTGILTITSILHLAGGTTWRTIIMLAMLMGLAGGVATTISSIQLALRQRAWTAFSQASDVWLRLGLAITGIAWFGATSSIALFGFLLATGVMAAIQLVWITRSPLINMHVSNHATISIQDQRKTMSELAAYGRPYIAFAAFAWLSTYGDRWFLLANIDEKAVGIYTALFQIANAPIALFLGIVNQFLVPLVFDRAGGASTQDQIRSSARLLNLATAPYVLALAGIIAAAAVMAEPLIELLTSKEFSTHAEILWIICLGLSLSSTAQMLLIKGLSQGRSRDYILPKFVQLLLLLISMLVLVRSLGLIGIAVSLCISSGGYLAMVIYTNRRLILRAP